MKKLIVCLAILMSGCHDVYMDYDDLTMVCTKDFIKCECTDYNRSLAAFVNCTCRCNQTAIVKKISTAR